MAQSSSVPFLHSQAPVPRPGKASLSVTADEIQAREGADIRIFRDGLLIARCKAYSIAPTRFFVRVDPLAYPVSTRLEIESVGSDGQRACSARLTVAVMQRSTRGIEIRVCDVPASIPGAGNDR